MEISEMRTAMTKALETIRAGDQTIREFAFILRGRLRTSRIGHDTLKELKTELKKYNIHTGQWKE